MLYGLVGWLLLTAAPDPATPAPPAPVAAAPAPLATPKVKTRPAFKSGPDAEFPDAAKANGENGKVVVSGVIGVDGRFTDLKVEQSSRSQLLDASALAAAARITFTPARDEAGTPVATPARVPFEFNNARTPGEGGGILRYRCGQFAKDQDWWARTWPADERDDMYLMSLGLSTMVRMQGGANPTAVLAANKDFDRRWKKAIEACRAKPDALLIDVFKPEGDWMRKLAQTPR